MVVNIKYYVHSTTKDNEAGIATGWLPGEISEKGWIQLAKMRKTTSREEFDVVICSDLTRAIDSALYLFGDRNMILPDTRLRECNYGVLNGRPNSEFKPFMLDHIVQPFPEGESYLDVEARMASFLKDLKANYPKKRVALVAHQGPQLALDVLLKHKTWVQAMNEDWRKTKAWKPGWDYTLI